ncbi:MAG: hypothetical protein K6L75_03590 [Cellvibrionaceae bacterium]
MNKSIVIFIVIMSSLVNSSLANAEWRGPYKLDEANQESIYIFKGHIIARKNRGVSAEVISPSTWTGIRVVCNTGKSKNVVAKPGKLAKAICPPYPPERDRGDLPGNIQYSEIGIWYPF